VNLARGRLAEAVKDEAATRVVYGVPGAETSTGFNALSFGGYCVKHRRAREAVSTIVGQRLEVRG
jgi:hypothetical protein